MDVRISEGSLYVRMYACVSVLLIITHMCVRT